jgi:hypothetical protein
MADKPDPENPADRYSEEETDRRMGQVSLIASH